jgi:hypothetical protein
MPTLTVVLPLFLAERTAAPASAVATVLVTNTLGVAFIQVRTARRVTDTATFTARRTRAGRAGALLEIEHQGERVVDALHLIEGQKARLLREAVEVHRGELITHDQSLTLCDDDRWPKAGRARSGACEGDDPRTQGQPVGLQYDGESATALLVALDSCW